MVVMIVVVMVVVVVVVVVAPVVVVIVVAVVIPEIPITRVAKEVALLVATIGGPFFTVSIDISVSGLK